MEAFSWDILALVFFFLAFAFLVTSIILFFKLRIREIMKDLGGSLEQEQIEEIRAKNMRVANLRGRVNVFEEMEKRVNPTKGNTSKLSGTNTGEMLVDSPPQKSTANPGTSVLRQSAKAVNSDFIIEKNIVFVNINEVI